MGASAYTKERLEEAADGARTLSEALERLGVTQRGKTWRARTPERLLVAQPAGQARRIPSDRLKWAMTSLGVPEHCARCGTEPVWRGRPLPLEVDHINGDWRDNRIENLRFLCPNCHSVTDNYRGRGKVRSRRGGAV
ncbi:HNH endonuclease signature motif containing protein [Streptomyces sp. F-1]|uniref:HNH endonuclease signature motif containing protein n=1 Tax=Streptomyces sp. F-1 TaxID=463642 RepID=UPI00085C5741|nr:HNH endonuclease signature motif containing protein [Streptomyces sp. F-1]SFY50325.1 hypothetical protein STEPF1_03574 [Streptomyces sp. F-1]